MDEREIELKTIAKHMVWLQDEFKNERLRDYEKDEIREELNKLRMKVLEKGYSVDLLVHYMEEYKTLTFEEYYKWIGKR